MKILKLEQGSEKWHELRKKSLGATTASVLEGINPYKKRLDLYNEMVEGKTSFFNDSMRKGVELEPEARKWCENQLEALLFPITAQDDELDYLHASFDGVSLDETVIVEIKCSKKTYEYALQEKIPEYYLWQMQQQMHIANVDSMYYCTYWDGKGKIINVKKDNFIILKILKNADDFFHNHLTPKISPGSTHKAFDEFELDTRKELLMDLMNREEIVKKIKHLEDLKKYLEEKIFNQVKENCEVGKWKLTKTTVKGQVDWDRIVRFYEIETSVLDGMRKPSREQWRITNGKESIQT